MNLLKKHCQKNAAIYNYLDYQFVQGLLKQHLSGEMNRRLLVWGLLNFNEWLKLNIKESSEVIVEIV